MQHTIEEINRALKMLETEIGVMGVMVDQDEALTENDVEVVNLGVMDSTKLIGEIKVRLSAISTFTEKVAKLRSLSAEFQRLNT